MARRYISASLLLLALTTDVRTQFFDFFQGLQPFQPYQAFNKPIQRIEHTTRKIKTETNRRGDKHTNKHEQTTKRYEGIERDDNNRQISKDKNNKRKQSTASIFGVHLITTTKKPIRKTIKNNNSSHNNNVNNNRNYNIKHNEALLTAEYGLLNPDRNNVHNDYYTQPNYNYNNNNYQSNSRPNYSSYTTQNPFYNGAGVRPAVVDNRPPITNRPITKRPNFSVTQRPMGSDDSPEVLAGSDEDYMSEVEKRRYVEIAERMCDKYKALTMTKVQAIPLIPSPEPVQVNVSSCAPTNIPLVVGGKVVSINEFPHMALLGWLKLNGAGYSWKCGGSLISEQYVLTAAHCAYQERDNSVITGPPRVVQLGSSYLDDPGALVVKVATVIRHPKYKLPKSYYDLALLKLVTPVSFSEVIKPACLGVPPSTGKNVIATGWGRTEFGGEQSSELRSVSLPIWDYDECYNILGTSRKVPEGPSRESQVCAGDVRGGKDTCQGDSGGPIQVQDGCLWRIVGVTSLGRSCGAQYTPGLYAIVQRAFVAAQVFGSRNSNSGRSNNNYGSNSGQSSGSYGSNNGQASNNYGSSNNYRGSSGQASNNYGSNSGRQNNDYASNSGRHGNNYYGSNNNGRTNYNSQYPNSNSRRSNNDYYDTSSDSYGKSDNDYDQVSSNYNNRQPNNDQPFWTW